MPDTISCAGFETCFHFLVISDSVLVGVQIPFETSTLSNLSKKCCRMA